MNHGKATMIDIRDTVDWAAYPNLVESNFRPRENPTLSQNIIAVLLSQQTLKLYSDSDEPLGFGQTTTRLGVTKDMAYSNWVSYIKRQESKFRSQLSTTLPQHVYDGAFMFKEMFVGGDTIITDNARYSFRDLLNESFNDFASVITNSRNNITPIMLGNIGSIIALNSYPPFLQLDDIANNGIRTCRSDYVSNRISTSKGRREARVNYYVHTSQFMPTATDAQNRETIAVINSLNQR